MAYATKEDMVKRFSDVKLIQLTNRDDPHADTINEDELNIALDDATAEIDTILGTRLPVPLNPVPAVIIPVCCDIARFRLYVGKATEEVKDRLDNAHKLLDRMAKGEVRVGVGDTNTSGSPMYSKPATVFDERLFT